MISYRQILRRSFSIAWKNKYLWFFGMFASFLSIGAEYKILMRSMDRNSILNWFSGWQTFVVDGIFHGQIFSWLLTIFRESPFVGFLFISMCLLILAAFIFVVWMVVSSQIVLVDNAKKIIKGAKDSVKISLHDEMRISQVNFWPVLCLNILVKIVVTALVFLVVFPLLFVGYTTVFVNVLYSTLFIILIPVAILAAFVFKYAIAYVILQKYDTQKAFNHAWILFKENWIISTEVSLLLFLISFLSTIAILIAAIIIFIPFFLFSISFVQIFSAAVSAFTVLLGISVAAIFIIVAGSFLATWQIIVWTHLFVSLNSHGGESKLERLIPENIKNIKLLKK
ncbi:MAG: hypothetical protein WCK37_03015 [Candidatus Falkowbacteria bacterium]